MWQRASTMTERVICKKSLCQGFFAIFLLWLINKIWFDVSNWFFINSSASAVCQMEETLTDFGEKLKKVFLQESFFLRFELCEKILIKNK
jgi:hypothetical protein